MSQITTLSGRCMYILKLADLVTAEMDIDSFVTKAKRAKLSSVWIKVADGQNRYANVTGQMAHIFGGFGEAK